MADTVVVVVDGLDTLLAQFGHLERSAGRGIQRKAMREAVKPVRNSARRFAPKRTGRGARSIQARVTVRGTKAEGKIGFSKKHFYLQFHETGTRKLRRHPFLRPALDQEAGNAVGIYRRVMAELIDEAIGHDVTGDGDETVAG